jgi:hypothetical protein
MDRFRCPGAVALCVSYAAVGENQGYMGPADFLEIALSNRASEIERVHCRVQRHFDSQPYNHEVLVENNGSTNIAEPFLYTLSSYYLEPRALVYGNNPGKGYATERGVVVAAFCIVADTDISPGHPSKIWYCSSGL